MARGVVFLLLLFCCGLVNRPLNRRTALCPSVQCSIDQVVVRKVNEDLNIPLLSESRERRLIEKVVDRILPKVEPSMQAIMPDVYVR